MASASEAIASTPHLGDALPAVHEAVVGAGALVAVAAPPPGEESGFHTPKPERYFIGTLPTDGQSWATVSGARLRLLEAHQQVCSKCGDTFLADGHFCQKCGAKRPVAQPPPQETLALGYGSGQLAARVAEATTGYAAPATTAYAASAATTGYAAPVTTAYAASAASSKAPVPLSPPSNPPLSNPSTITNGLSSGLMSAQGWHERLKEEHQDISRRVLAEEVAEAQTQAQLDSELATLKQRSTEEANAINDVFHQIGGAGHLLRDELHDMDEVKVLLEAELLGEENQRYVWEAELRAEESELCSRVEAQQHQLEEMAVSRRCMESHLGRMRSMQVWLRDDIEDVRRTRSAVEVMDKREHEERGEEIERATSELHLSIQELRSDHDTWRAQAENEVFRLRQESKRQAFEERELSEQIHDAQTKHSEVRTKLRENVASCSKEDEELTRRILQLREETRQQSEANEPRMLVELQNLAEECQVQEQNHGTLLADIELLNNECSQARQHAEDFRRWEMTEGSAARMTEPERREKSRLELELRDLNQRLYEGKRFQRELEADIEQGRGGILGFCRRRSRKDPPDLEASPARRPPLPPPNSSPVPDPDRGPYAFREGP